MRKNWVQNMRIIERIIRRKKLIFFNNRLNTLPIHEQFSKLDLKKTQMDFEATSSYSSAVWDKKSVYPKIETGYAFKHHMNDVFVNSFNNETFNQDVNDSVILKRKKNYNPPNPVFEHLPKKEKVKNIELIRMRKGFIIGTLTSVDFCEPVKMGEKVIEIYERVLHREILKISPFRKIIGKIFF